MPIKNQLQGMLAVFEPLDRTQSKKNFEPYYFKHVQFHFSDRITYNLWEKTKVETLSAVYTKNQNSKNYESIKVGVHLVFNTI
jgi:hypothetical protein